MKPRTASTINARRPIKRISAAERQAMINYLRARRDFLLKAQAQKGFIPVQVPTENGIICLPPEGWREKLNYLG